VNYKKPGDPRGTPQVCLKGRNRKRRRQNRRHHYQAKRSK